MKPLAQHQVEIERNKDARASKPLIRQIYRDFYEELVQELNRAVPGPVVEIGAGSGELKERVPEAISTDLFPNPWLDVVCDAYRLPFAAGSISNLVLFDVFHHLARPKAFLSEAARVLPKGGRVLLFEPYVSVASWLPYGCFHHEPIGWNRSIDLAESAPEWQDYYAAQGNATRLFFRQPEWLPAPLKLASARAQAAFAYLLSGGLSKPALYPDSCYGALRWIDRKLSAFPRLFGGRCLVVLVRQ